MGFNPSRNGQRASKPIHLYLFVCDSDRKFFFIRVFQNLRDPVPRLRGTCLWVHFWVRFRILMVTSFIYDKAYVIMSPAGGGGIARRRSAMTGVDFSLNAFTSGLCNYYNSNSVHPRLPFVPHGIHPRQRGTRVRVRFWVWFRIVMVTSSMI